MKITTTDNNEPMTYSIVGLPKSGTSILAKVMNSIGGSTCLSEPIRTMHSINLANGAKTIHDYECIQQQTNNFLKGFDKYIKVNSSFLIGGTKETFIPIKSRVSKEIDKIFKNRDFLMFIIREPKATYSRWKELKWTSEGQFRPSIRFNVETFCCMYEELIEVFHEIKMHKPCVLIRYEDFCENFSNDWINSSFKGMVEFEGEIGKLNQLNGSGDLKCKQTEEILRPNKEYTSLTELETELIDARLHHLYTNVRGYGYY